MKIHHEGTATILIFFAIVVISILLAFYFSRCFKMTLGISILMMTLWFIVLFFFRVPKRQLTLDNHSIVSPANGKVVAIKEIVEKEFFKKKCIQVSIFMSPLNVHLNKYPISGEVAYSNYHPGKYLVAWAEKSSEVNESHSVVIVNQHTEILVKQIAGFLARRIVNYAHKGNQVKQNDELGFIKFGSRVDLYLPLNTKLKVKLGDYTTEGVTPIAVY